MRSVTVAVYDSDGLNFAIKGANALEITKSIFHSLRINYVLIDYMHASFEQREDNKYCKDKGEREDFAFYLDR